MASGTLSSAGIARHTIWAARLVVLAVFLDLFVQFPTIAPFAEGLGASAALVGIVVAAYSVTNLFGNLGAGIRTRQVGPPATHCRWSGDHDRRRIQLLAGPDVGAVDRRKGDAWDWRGSAGAGCVLHDRRSSPIRQMGSGHGPDRCAHRRRGPGGTSGRRHPAGHVGR